MESDPFAVGANWNLAFRLYWARRFEEAIRQLDHTVELAGENPLIWFTLAYVHPFGGRPDRSAPALGRWGDLLGIHPDTTAHLASLALDFQRTGSPNPGVLSKGILELLPFYWRYRLAAHVGDESTAFQLLEEADFDLWVHLVSLNVDPVWDPFRDHPRFQALLEGYGLEKEN